MLRIVPSGLEPLDFAGVGASWLPLGGDPTDSGLAAACECAGVALTTIGDRLTRLSVMNSRHHVVTFIGCLRISRHALIKVSGAVSPVLA